MSLKDTELPLAVNERFPTATSDAYWSYFRLHSCVLFSMKHKWQHKKQTQQEKIPTAEFQYSQKSHKQLDTKQTTGI